MADATWEPESHLVNAPVKVAEYWDRLGVCNAGWLSVPEDASELASSDESSVVPDTQPCAGNVSCPHVRMIDSGACFRLVWGSCKVGV